MQLNLTLHPVEMPLVGQNESRISDFQLVVATIHGWCLGVVFPNTNRTHSHFQDGNHFLKMAVQRDCLTQNSTDGDHYFMMAAIFSKPFAQQNGSDMVWVRFVFVNRVPVSTLDNFFNNVSKNV